MTMLVRQRLGHVVVLFVLAALVSACAASRAFTRGERAAIAGDWDAAVEYYRQAMQDDPDRAEYKIAYERATFAAAGQHADRARRAEEEGRLDEALREYRRAAELDIANRQAAAKASELERTLRDRLEAARPPPPIEQLREQAQRLSPEPLLSPTTPLGPVRFADASLRDILAFIGQQTGINVVFDAQYQDRTATINVEGQTVEQALQQLMLNTGSFYKVLNERTIIVIQDTPPNRTRYEDQSVKVVFLSHADATEMVGLLNLILRIPGLPVAPQFAPNKTANSVTVRGSTAVVSIAERILRANDNPRAEVIVDVQILEVNRERAKQFGLNLSSYQIGGSFSPEAAPAANGATTPFNLNTISQGVSTADFYLTLPTALLRFLESDNRTKVLAKGQLRGSAGQEVELNLGEEIPVPQTTFVPLAGGGATSSPLTSFALKQVGLNVTMTPRVNYEGDISLTLLLENSARGGDVNVAGQNLPSFTTRRVTTNLRLRDGEPNLIAGLLREDERRSLTGFPGIIRVPLLQQLFGSTDNNVRQTDIVMLLTPRILRSQELNATDLATIYIGPQSNLSLGGGPPPLIGGTALDPAVPDPAIVTTPPPPPAQPTLQLPAGSSPVPGFVTPPPTTPPTTVPPTSVFGLPIPEPAPAGAPTPPAPVAAPARDPVVTPTPTAPPTPSPAAGASGRIFLSAPATMTVGGGPYNVPISIANAARLSMLSLTVSYNPAVLRVRNVQEGTFMRQGNIAASFSSQPDAGGRVDIVITRPGDLTGAVGTGLLAGLLFEPVAAGSSAIGITGVGTAVGTGASAALQFTPTTVVVK